MSNTAKCDLALQKERLTFLIYHVDWRDQFTFVLLLVSPLAFFMPEFGGKTSSLQFYRMPVYRQRYLPVSGPDALRALSYITVCRKQSAFAKLRCILIFCNQWVMCVK